MGANTSYWMVLYLFLRLRGCKSCEVSLSGVPPPVQLYAQRAAGEGYKGNRGAQISSLFCYVQDLSCTVPCLMVANFGLRNRDTQDFLACIMSDKDEQFTESRGHSKEYNEDVCH